MVPSKKRKGGLPSISKAEWQVMKVLWARGELAARDVCAALPEELAWSDRTVKTLLSRLVAKGALGYEQIGNSYLYRTAVSREDVTREEVSGFVSRVFDGASLPVLARFIEDHDLSDEEIDELRALLDTKRGRRGGRRGGAKR